MDERGQQLRHETQAAFNEIHKLRELTKQVHDDFYSSGANPEIHQLKLRQFIQLQSVWIKAFQRYTDAHKALTEYLKIIFN